MKKRILFISTLLSASLFFSGCTLRSETAADSNATKVTSTEVATTKDLDASTGDSDDTAVAATEIVSSEDSATAVATENTESASFSATMLNVEQGLSILIQSDGHNMLYDGGNRAHSSYVVAYLQQHGIDSLDYMVASHYDEDHIAGLVGVLNTTDVDTVICPDYQADSKIYASFVTAEEKSRAQIEHPDVGTDYLLGDAKIEILQDDPSLSEANDRSIAVRVSYGTFSILLTGDCEQDAEEEMIHSGINLHSDLYVAGHHGSSSSTSQDFLTAVGPSYVWISCGLNNSYGHPHKETMEKLSKDGAKIFRTDLQGEVSVYSDGKSYWFSCDPSDDWRCGNEISATGGSNVSVNTTETVESADDAAVTANASEAETYVLNTHTLKFHRADCDAVEKMSDGNKETSNLSRDELISQGYSPCGICKP